MTLQGSTTPHRCTNQQFCSSCGHKQETLWVLLPSESCKEPVFIPQTLDHDHVLQDWALIRKVSAAGGFSVSAWMCRLIMITNQIYWPYFFCFIHVVELWLQYPKYCALDPKPKVFSYVGLSQDYGKWPTMCNIQLCAMSKCTQLRNESLHEPGKCSQLCQSCKMFPTNLHAYIFLPVTYIYIYIYIYFAYQKKTIKLYSSERSELLQVTSPSPSPRKLTAIVFFGHGQVGQLKKNGLKFQAGARRWGARRV